MVLVECLCTIDDLVNMERSSNVFESYPLATITICAIFSAIYTELDITLMLQTRSGTGKNNLHTNYYYV